MVIEDVTIDYRYMLKSEQRMDSEKICEEKVIKEIKICCPKCNTEQISKATWRVCDPFVNYTHECIKCGYMICESEF